MSRTPSAVNPAPQPAKRMLRALGGESLASPPVWLMRQAGRYLPEYRAIRAEAKGFLDLCFTPDMAVEVTLQPIRRYGFDAAILFSDILVVPHALGQKVWFEEGAGPRLDAVLTLEPTCKLLGGEVPARVEHVQACPRAAALHARSA